MNRVGPGVKSSRPCSANPRADGLSCIRENRRPAIWTPWLPIEAAGFRDGESRGGRNIKTIKTRKGEEILVDDDVIDFLSTYTWFITNRGYAVRAIKKNGKTDKVFMHRQLLDAQKGQQVDHRDGNRLNNQKGNLRICTSLQNSWNRTCTWSRTGFKGVVWHARRKKPFQARIKINGHQTSIGYYYTAEEAYIAYCTRAREIFGEFFHPGTRQR